MPAGEPNITYLILVLCPDQKWSGTTLLHKLTVNRQHVVQRTSSVLFKTELKWPPLKVVKLQQRPSTTRNHLHAFLFCFFLSRVNKTKSSKGFYSPAKQNLEYNTWPLSVQTKTSILHTHKSFKVPVEEWKVLFQISLCFSQLGFKFSNECALIIANN